MFDLLSFIYLDLSQQRFLAPALSSDAIPSVNDSHLALAPLPNDNYNGGRPSLNFTRR